MTRSLALGPCSVATCTQEAGNQSSLPLPAEPLPLHPHCLQFYYQRKWQPLVEPGLFQKAGPALPPLGRRQSQVEFCCLYLRSERSLGQTGTYSRWVGFATSASIRGWKWGVGRGERVGVGRTRPHKNQELEPEPQPCPASQATPTPPWTNTLHTVGCSHLSTSWCRCS